MTSRDPRTVLASLARRGRALLRRGDVDAEIEEELRFHLEQAVAQAAAEARRRGLDPERAGREARRAFGGMTQARETYRDALGVRLADAFLHDLRWSVRTLARDRGFTVVAAATLALGIGASSAVFSVVNGVLLRPLPYEAPDRVAVVWETDRESGTTREQGSVPDYFDYAARAHALAALGAIAPAQANLAGDDGEAERIGAAGVTHTLFAALGVRPALGRVITADDDRPGAPAVAVVTDRFWRTHLGGSPEAIGRRLRLDDSVVTVVGVLPARVAFPDAATELWLPLRLTPTSAPRSRHWITMVGRLTPRATMAGAQRELAGVAAQLEAENARDDRGRGVHVEPLADVVVGDARQPLLVLLGAVLLLALVACANTASLFVARHSARVREVAVRTALGASRRRIAAQCFVESLVLALLGGALGVVVAWGGVRGLLALAPPELPRVDEVRIDGVVLGATLALTLVVAIAFGLLPAAAREGAEGWRGALAGGARAGTSRAHRRFRAALVVGEIAVALALAAGAALLGQSLRRLRAVDPGFAARGLARVSFALPRSRYPQSFANYPMGFIRTIAFQRELVARVRALPGVRGAAVAGNDPITNGFTNSFVIEGREAEAARGQPELATRPVSDAYFATAGIPLVRGRMLSPRDDERAPLVVVLNEAAARRLFPDADPIGHRIRFWGMWHEIVGVVGNERFAGLASDPPPAMYPPIAQAPMSVATLLVRAAGDDEGAARRLLPAVRTALRGLDPQVAPFDVATMDDAVRQSMAERRFTTGLTTAFAGAALLLALVGVYGIVAYTVTQRVPEFGIRLALGASERALTGSVLGEGLRLALAGTALGVLGALAVGRAIAGQLYATSPADPRALAFAVGAVVVIAVVASWLPARRAARVPPGVALRAE